jgi:hypothetical protein
VRKILPSSSVTEQLAGFSLARGLFDALSSIPKSNVLTVEGAAETSAPASLISPLLLLKKSANESAFDAHMT